MPLQKISKKIIKRLSYHAFQAFGMDAITRIKITKRNDLQKFGTDYGGWVIPTRLIDEHSICYCVGCGEDISFDLSLIDHFNCDVYGFDPTPRAIEYVKSVVGQNPKYHFYNVGLWDAEDTLKFFVPKNPTHVSHSLVNLQKTNEHILIKVNRLSSLMKDLGHEKIDLLKIDIEGAEYKVIESIIEDGINIKVICVEYDECSNPLDSNYKDRVQTSVHHLQDNGYSLVSVQDNGNYMFVRNI